MNATDDSTDDSPFPLLLTLALPRSDATTHTGGDVAAGLDMPRPAFLVRVRGVVAFRERQLRFGDELGEDIGRRDTLWPDYEKAPCVVLGAFGLEQF